MKFCIVALIGTSLCGTILARFAYEQGNCEISMFGVVQDLLKSEVRALINPKARYSNYKYIEYDLYTNKNPYKRQLLTLGNVDSLKKSYFNASWPTRFSIHGWTGKSVSCSNAAVKDAYLERGNFNVILVDWSQYSLDISYARISKQLAAIAASFVEFINFLQRETGATYEQMYLIGHSAGAHIAGLAGKLIKPQRFGAIFALDPAGLSQLGLSAPNRLAPSDATYVESIHTDISILGNPTTELSHATFFVNWGQGQPQCPNKTATEFDFACDHFSALYYFAESIRNPLLFGAIQCKNVSATTKTTSTTLTTSTSNDAAATTFTTSNIVAGTLRRGHNIEKFNCDCTHVANNNKNNNNAAVDNDDSEANDATANGDGAATNLCTAVVFMGGEPAVAKNGIFYLSTKSRPPFGTGALVRRRTPLKPNFLRSFVSQRVFNKIYFGL